MEWCNYSITSRLTPALQAAMKSSEADTPDGQAAKWQSFGDIAKYRSSSSARFMPGDHFSQMSMTLVISEKNTS
jgi:hypothetical protein